MNVGDKKRIRFRIKFVASFLLLGMATIVARAYQLQILEKDKLDVIARNGYIETTKLPSKRGTIYDRKGRELAMSIETKSVYAHPNQVKEKRRTADALARILKKRRTHMLRLLQSKKTFAWIDRKIPPNRAQSVQAANFEGIGVTTEIRRYYPGKESGAHLIGFVGTDNQGLEGLENNFDSFLRGPQSCLIQMRDAMGRSFSVSEPINDGCKLHDLILTIDKDIQFKAQESLRFAVKKSKAIGGHCIVVDPKTGEVLAMVVEPEFNPNDFSAFRPSHWRNRAVTDCYEPGSVIKTFLLAACLDKRVLTAGTRIDCEQGKYKIGSSIIHDTKEHAIISVSDIIMYSSNIGGVKMGQRLGYATFCDYLKKFGFGATMGTDFLGQRHGFIRPVENAKAIDQANLFFGQGMTATSLQTVMAMAAIANDGKLMRPYVVKAIVNDSGRVVEETRPKVIRQVISRGTAKEVSRILETVVTDEGTGLPASIEGFRVAGKTGTSQKVDPKTKRYSWTKYTATFLGFVPADDPRLVILVSIDEPKGTHYGGLVAGPVFREVGQWSMNYFRINPEIRAYESDKNMFKRVKATIPSTRYSRKVTAVDNGVLPDFRGLCMREAVKKGRDLGLKVALEGTGIAVNQVPKPGSSLNRIQIVKLKFEPPR